MNSKMERPSLSITEYPGFLWRRKGCCRRDICIHKKRETANAQETTSKKYKQTNPSATRKWSKRKTNIKCLKKERKREQRKENKKQNTKIYSSKLQCKKQAARTKAARTKNCAKRGHIFTKTCDNKQYNDEMVGIKYCSYSQKQPPQKELM